jgi:glycosyltransferase involved in cell wall biosynthesis
MKVGILASEFLVNIGANDFLRNLLKGLGTQSEVEIVFIAPSIPVAPIPNNGAIQFIKRLVRSPRVRGYLRSALTLARGALSRTPTEDDQLQSYAYYLNDLPRVSLVSSIYSEVDLKKVVRTHGIDVLFPSIHRLSFGCPYVTYWPDCQPKHFPEYFDSLAQEARDTRIRQLLDSGAPMIVNSLDARRDLVRFYGANPEQIFSLPFCPILDEAVISAAMQVDAETKFDEYFIVCNQFWIHKSLETVLQAASLLKKQGFPINIVFTGKMEEPRKPGYIAGLMELVKSLDIDDVIEFKGYVAKDVQMKLMMASRAVIQPTLFEGGPGGGSVFDALSIGVPVIVSDIEVNKELPSINEVTFFQTKDPHSLSEAIKTVALKPKAPIVIEVARKRSSESSYTLGQTLFSALKAALAGNFSSRGRVQ